MKNSILNEWIWKVKRKFYFNNNQMQTTNSDELFTVNKMIPRIGRSGELLIYDEIVNFLLEQTNFKH